MYGPSVGMGIGVGRPGCGVGVTIPPEITPGGAVAKPEVPFP